MLNPTSLIRPIIRDLHGYVPGEQPKIKGLIKLNTNENPYPPSPHVLDAIKRAVDGRLRLYPNPTAQALRERLARWHGCGPENIIVGNGSDDLLALATRAFVEPKANRPAPQSRRSARPRRVQAESRSRVQFFAPSYSLYPVLAAIHGAETHPVPLGNEFALPPQTALKSRSDWDARAALTFITTPNAPSGRGYSRHELDGWCRAQKGVVVLDEAYVDFASEHALPLALEHPHVLVARTFSKAYSLCFLRVGYFVGHASLIEALDKIRDSYNVNGLGQVAALATLEDLDYYHRRFREIIRTRTQLTEELERCGFAVCPSQTNFILVKPPRFPAPEWLSRLRRRKLLVRWFAQPNVSDYLRITIGTPDEAAALVKAVQAILR